MAAVVEGLMVGGVSSACGDAMSISLLDFFRSASFGGVRVGFHRCTVESILGEPDLSIPGHSPSTDYRQAGLWVYAGIEFTFVDLTKDLLSEISFRPSYLHPRSSYSSRASNNTKLDAWIFSGRKEPTVNRLRLALGKEGIVFRDTGVETCVFDREEQQFVPMLTSSGCSPRLAAQRNLAQNLTKRQFSGILSASWGVA